MFGCSLLGSLGFYFFTILITRKRNSFFLIAHSGFLISEMLISWAHFLLSFVLFFAYFECKSYQVISVLYTTKYLLPDYNFIYGVPTYRKF